VPGIRDSSIAVTGGCGFIGSHLVAELARRGARRIVVIDSLRYGKRENLPADVPVEIVQHELGFGDVAELLRALGGVDQLFHLAAEKHNQSKDDPSRVLRSNVEGTATLYTAAARAGVKKIVFSSSLYAYGRLDGPPMLESEIPLPRTVYGISKLTGEHLLAFFGREHGLEHVTLRYFFVYGPRQFAGTGYKSVIVKSFERLIRGEPAVIFGDGLQSLDYVYVDDAVDATCRAMEAPISGELLNVGSGVATRVGDLVALITRVAGGAPAPEHGPPDWTAGSHRVGDVARIQSVLGWKAQTSLEEGLRNTMEWIRGA
jgi:nucleoside-diphosphate-sugar epimerase